MAIAQARAAARGLPHGLAAGSLLDLPGSGLGPFDYIDCCGVLHHLPDPAAGLAALLSVLAPGGGLGLMVYAPHGRTGVYMLQDALGLLAPAGEPPAARLDVARRVMRHLPDTRVAAAQPLVRRPYRRRRRRAVRPAAQPARPRLRRAGLHALLDGAGLRVTCLMEPLRYDPAVFLPDPKLRARLAALDPAGAAALAEALTGNMSTHVVYCVRAAEAPAAADPCADARAGRAGDAGRGAGAQHPAGRHAALRVRRAARAGAAAASWRCRS